PHPGRLEPGAGAVVHLEVEHVVVHQAEDPAIGVEAQPAEHRAAGDGRRHPAELLQHEVAEARRDAHAVTRGGSAVTGSIIANASSILFAGKPPRSACSRMMSASGAR